ncbi:MAG: hypothetical protein IJ418_17965 [Clostridia bacterium]|nr:hypothetical protein [Clostridia bacterium]
MKKATFTEIMQQNGFQYTGKTSYDGNFIYGREWRKTANVLWYGEMESSFRIEVYESYGYPMVTLYENGRQIDRRDYSSPKRCINALREILKIRGYEF